MKILKKLKAKKIEKIAFNYIAEELLEQSKNLINKEYKINSDYEYRIIDRVDGMLSLASELGLMSNKKIKKLNIIRMKNEKIINNT